MIHKKHIAHYFSLVGILAATVVGFLMFSYDKDFQFAITTACCTGYFSWGLVHHLIHKDLNMQIIIEYLMISVVGFVIATSVIFRS